MLKKLLRKVLPNPFDQLLKKAQRKNQKTILIVWNRGLGDIALGLYAMVYRIRQYIPEASITFLTRENLSAGFQLLQDVQVLVAPSWKRNEPIHLSHTLAQLGVNRSQWDLVIESADPTYWVRWQLSNLTPLLHWEPSWDVLSENFSLCEAKGYVGVHVQTETQYGYEKNWPIEKFVALFAKIYASTGKKVLLFGSHQEEIFDRDGLVDLRGKTNLLELLSIIKNFCSHLLVPDSGVLSLTYYINQQFPIQVVSLWADPHQGILKQNVPSPNRSLSHIPLVASSGDLQQIGVEEVYNALFTLE